MKIEKRTKLLAWHFTAVDKRLTNGDNRDIVIGETIKVQGPIEPCRRGLHGSESAYDALQYAPGPILWRVELSGEIVAHGNDKHAASERTAIAGGIDATDMLRKFARLCALDVIHLWDAPPIARQYLETGDDELRDAAWDVAWDVAGDAAGNAARNAAGNARDARAARAAWAAARDAAWAAAREAAWTDAWTDARDAARAAQRERFESMCQELMKVSGLR